MAFFSWLRNRAPIRPPRGRAQHRPAAQRFRPRLEALEGRCVPSTLTVTNLYDSGPGSLRYEIAQATSKDNSIVFDAKLHGGTITLISGELVISKSLTIKGRGQTITSQQLVDASFTPHNGSRIFEVDGAGTNVTISGLTITGGGGTHVGGNFNVNDWPNEGYGGAILNFGTLTLSGCTLGGNTMVGPSGLYGNSAEYGGAIANFGTMTVSNCFVVQNSAAEGGAIYNAGTATVSGCTLSGNTAHPVDIANTWIGGVGDGIYNAGTAAALTVSHSTFSVNNPDDIFGPYVGGHNTFG